MTECRALVIGINEYPNAPLGGCVQDALDWEAVLAVRDYDVQVVVDGAATKAVILSKLAEHIARTSYGDRLVVTYSGHGSWLPDRNGDEPDGRDECLVPVDYSQAGLITDDELFDVFGRRRFGARIAFVSDSCFSGTVQRAVPLAGQGTPRFLPPMYHLDGEQLARAYRAETTPVRGRSRRSVLLMSACSDSEVSYDTAFNGRPNGAYSRIAIDALARPGSGTYGGWHANIRDVLPSGQYPQTPQLDATWLQRHWSALD